MQYNDIGIDRTIDWTRIRKLLIIGLIAGCMGLVGDMILGYGVYDGNLTGLDQHRGYLDDGRSAFDDEESERVGK